MTILIETEDELAENQIEDNNNISKILYISYFLRTTSLLFIILFGSYIFGQAWFIYCDYTRTDEDNFIEAFEMDSKLNHQKSILLTYFTFTSMSTVGLGDYHPISNFERILGAFFLLSGVATTSFIVENFMSMINAMNEL